MRHPVKLVGRRRGRSREEGAVYIAALLALMVLSLMALTLASVSQTEMVLGVNDQAIQKAFYEADSGLAVATARVLVAADYGADVYTLPDASPTLNGVETDVDASPFYPILNSWCHLCQINNAGRYSGSPYQRINHAVSVSATQVVGPERVPRARRTVAAMVDVQPWRNGPEAYLALTDPAQLKKLSF